MTTYGGVFPNNTCPATSDLQLEDFLSQEWYLQVWWPPVQPPLTASWLLAVPATQP